MGSFNNFYIGNYFSPKIDRSSPNRLFISDEEPNLADYKEVERKEYLRDCGKFVRERILEYLSIVPNPLHKSTWELCLELDKEDEEYDNE